MITVQIELSINCFAQNYSFQMILRRTNYNYEIMKDYTTHNGLTGVFSNTIRFSNQFELSTFTDNDAVLE